MTRAFTVETLDAETILDLELDGIKLIEASAGTGKTHTIADLYLRQVLAGRETSEILIVTYTNAATEELRGRIQNRLYQAVSLLGDDRGEADTFMQLLRDRWQSLDDETRQQQLARLQLALRSLDEAAISTIHSFCQRALQEQALAGNQLFENELLTNDDAIWEAAARDWWRSLSYDLDRDSWLLIQDALGSIDKLTGLVLDLRNKPAARLLPESDENLGQMLLQPRELAAQLHQLAPQWKQHRSDIIEILKDSKALSRAKTLPYHPAHIDDWLDAADYFFNAPAAGTLFDNFQFLSAEWLNRHSKNTQRGKDSRLEHPLFVEIDAIARSWSEFNSRLAPRLRVDALDKISRQALQRKRERASLAFQDQLSLLLQALESDTGASMAQNLRRQYPVAMIDEFQDTDSVQYRIFRQIYPSEADCSLTLIGDPKQAIYSFRGGDVFTYMQARRLPSIRYYSLDTNWRSEPALVRAVNTVFESRADAFIYSDSIDFHPVMPIDDNERYRLLSRGSSAAMTLWQLPQTDEGKNYSRDEMRELINSAVVTEISELLEQSRQQVASIDGKPVKSGDIAILVRQAAEGQALSQALHRQGIRTVTIGRDSVFTSDEATGLYDLLLAISQYQDPAIAARSLASNLLQLDYREIGDIVDNDRRWQQWQEKLAELHQLWERQGFIAMFQTLLQYFEVTRQLAQRDSSERRITNLLHLAELLQQQSRRSAGMTPLLSWLQEQFDENGGEEAELRLENDEELVKIVTIHKAKGLQYPIVFVPFLWSCRPVQRSQAVSFHDEDLNACIDLGSEDFNTHLKLAEKERLAEDLRLLYVALTRARSRLFLAWGPAGASSRAGYASQTALAYLLHSRQHPSELETSTVNGFPDDMDFEADLQALVEKSDKTIECVELPHYRTSVSGNPGDSDRVTPQLASFSPSPAPQWRVNSFTALTRGVHQPATPGSGTGDDDPILDFPAGSHVGLLLHSLLENLDFEADVEMQSKPLFARFLAQAGLSSEHEPRLTQWLQNILQTPLDNGAMTLDSIGNRCRLNELAFDFALDRLDIDGLNRFMQARVEQPLQELNSADFRGLVTGVIDLVFEYQGRYYLADYKSNYLGNRLQDYEPAQLQQAMLDRRYDLQSLLYALALHRFLGVRQSNYDYDQHFGGSYYLFLRAMRPQQGNRYGIHFERPDLDTMRQFDELFRYSPAEVLDA